MTKENRKLILYIFIYLVFLCIFPPWKKIFREGYCDIGPMGFGGTHCSGNFIINMPIWAPPTSPKCSIEGSDCVGIGVNYAGIVGEFLFGSGIMILFFSFKSAFRKLRSN